MYCKECGAEIDSNSAFCDKCGEQNKALEITSEDLKGYMAVQVQTQKEKVVFSAGRALGTRNMYIIFAILEALFSFLILPMIFMFAENKVSLTLTEMKYSSLESYYKISQLEDKLESMHSIFTVITVIMIALGLVTTLNLIAKAVRIHNTSLLLTNVGIVGNTGESFGNKTLHAPYHEITNATVKKFGFGNIAQVKYGWVIIEIKWVEKYSFFIKEPNFFIFNLNEQKKAQRKH